MVDYAFVRETLRLARERTEIERRGQRRVGMTLDEAAAVAGINRSTIHSIENIRREPQLKPEIDTLDKLASTYGLQLVISLVPSEPDSSLAKPGSADEAVSTLPPEADVHTSFENLGHQIGGLYAEIHRLEQLYSEMAQRRGARLRDATRRPGAGAGAESPTDGVRRQRRRRRPARRPAGNAKR